MNIKDAREIYQRDLRDNRKLELKESIDRQLGNLINKGYKEITMDLKCYNLKERLYIISYLRNNGFSTQSADHHSNLTVSGWS